MKAKILNRDVCDTKETFNVLSINYDYVMVQLNNEKKVFKRSDIEIIPENSSENIFIKYEDVLKVKLNKGISGKFYVVLINHIENILEEKVCCIDVLEDEYGIIKKGIWEKRLFLVINKRVAFKIGVIGKKYATDFRFTIKQFSMVDTINFCNEKIEDLDEQINQNKILKHKYKDSLKYIINSSITNTGPVLLQN